MVLKASEFFQMPLLDLMLENGADKNAINQDVEFYN